MRKTAQKRTSPPFFGTHKVLMETINTLDNKWLVQFWEIQYFFFGIEIFRFKRELVTKNRSLKGKV